MESEIIKLLKNIEKRLELIEQHLGIVKEDCSKMGNHIVLVAILSETCIIITVCFILHMLKCV